MRSKAEIVSEATEKQRKVRLLRLLQKKGMSHVSFTIEEGVEVRALAGKLGIQLGKKPSRIILRLQRELASAAPETKARLPKRRRRMIRSERRAVEEAKRAQRPTIPRQRGKNGRARKNWVREVAAAS